MIQVSYQVIDDQKIRTSNNANNESDEIISKAFVRDNKLHNIWKIITSQELDTRVYIQHVSGNMCQTRINDPKIQHLVTPLILQKRRVEKAANVNYMLRNKEEVEVYNKAINIHLCFNLVD